MFSNVFERWKPEWIDGIGLFDGTAPRPQTDSHLNSVSIEYPEQEVANATRNFDPASMLGSGTFGSVYKGTMKDGTEVAIKVLQVPEEAGFEEEVKVLSRFRHPNLVILMGFSRHAGTGGRSLIYEYLAGGDVSRRLQKSRQKSEVFDFKQRLSAALDAASGLSHLHNANPRAFHRDIKGPNILLDKNGGAKMADFGLSCVSQSAHYKVQQASGTVGYACSEYIRTGVITEGSEVHSFGMVLLELLTAAPPAVQRPDKPSEFCYLVDHLQGSLSKAMQMKDETGNFPTPLAQAIAEMSFRCINPKPDQRPNFVQLVGELRRLLAEYSEHAGAQAPAGHQQSAVPPRHAPATPAAVVGAPAASPQANGVRASGQGQAGSHPQGMAHQMQGLSANFSANQSVEVRRANGHRWFRGRIMRVNQGNTFAIRYDDEIYEDQVPLHLLRPLEASQAPERPLPAPPPQDAGRQQARQQISTPPAPAPPPPPQRNPGQSRGDQQPYSRADQHTRTPPAAMQGGYRGTGAGHPGQVSNERSTIGASPSRDRTAQLPWCRLSCIFAEGVSELAHLREHQRQIDWPKGSNELVVGRTVQPPSLWDTLVPDARLRGTVSREHFKITANMESQSSSGRQTVTFHLTCLSLNGLLLNTAGRDTQFVKQGDAEKLLQHGDILAFAANLDAADRGPSGAQGLLPRKPFIHFMFEQNLNTATAAAIPSLAPGLESAHEASSSSSSWIEEDAAYEGEPAMRPPEGSAAGRWKRIATNSKDEALFCLEVHGDCVRMNLPSEARQLFYDYGKAATPPTLRLGRLYQRGFWQRVLKPEWHGGKTLDSDLFEVRPIRRSNPATRELPEWKYRMRVLTAKGMRIRYSSEKLRGEECDLSQSDTLTVELPPLDASSTNARGPSASLLGGLHFTFIPYSANSRSASLEQPRSLPCPVFDDQADDIGGIIVERTTPSNSLYSRTVSVPNSNVSSLSSKSAGALRAPVQVAEDPDAEVPPLLKDASAPRLGATPMKTIDLGPGEPVLDPDDLFSKTGFVAPSMEGRIPEIAGSRASVFKTPFAHQGLLGNQASSPVSQIRSDDASKAHDASKANSHWRR